MPIPKGVEILTPWQVIRDTPEIKNRAEQLSGRLQSDLPPNHVLSGLAARAVATRMDCDDVLFEIDGAEMALAVVHMTWRKEADPRWPSTRLFQSWEQWVRDEMLPAHEEYGAS